MKIPDYVENKPDSVREEWKNIYDRYSEDGESVGLGVANKWLESFKPLAVDNFVFVTEGDGITARSIGGTEYVDFLLTDNKHDGYGTKYSNEFLERLAEYINDNPQKLAEADFNHETLNKLMSSGYGKEGIRNSLKGLKKGVARAVKAIYEKGKLYIRTIVNPRYRNRILSAKGVSIEGSFVREGDTFIDGTMLGFSIIDGNDKELGNPRAKRL